ncbi:MULTISPECIES: DUF4179 domain-containing protein [unclassified Clostridium]|uniref:DUF4179 domain-containing protein n=1 Tax=unclassified Clostridium TaxID=2614128 RepID=UPI0020793067
MDNKNFDKILKDKIKSKYNNVPDKIDLMIQETLDSLKPKEQKRYRKVISIAVICFCVLFASIGVGITTTANALGLPVKDFIAEIMGLSPQYSDYASDVNITKESNGVNFTITSVLYDGYKLKIAYKVEGTVADSLEKLAKLSSFLNTKVSVNGKEVNLTSSGYSKPINSNTVGGINIFDIDDTMYDNSFMGLTQLDILDTFNFNISIEDEIDNEKYKWDFNIPISSEKIKSKIEEYSLDNTVGDYKIKNVIVTPISTYISGTFKDSKDKISIMNYIVVDDKGREVKIDNCNESTGVGGGKFRCEILNNDSELNSLTFIPYKNKQHYSPEEMPSTDGEAKEFKKAYREKLQKEISLTLSENGFNFTGDSELNITKVVREENKTKIYYETKYPTMVNLRLNISRDDIKTKSNNNVENVESIESGVGVVTLNGILEDKTYNLIYDSPDKSLEVYKERAVTVELK